VVDQALLLVSQEMTWKFWRGSAAREGQPARQPLACTCLDEGLLVSGGQQPACGLGIEAQGVLEELRDDGVAHVAGGGSLIPWSALYLLLDDAERGEDLRLLPLPEAIAAVPRLASRGSLTDPDFAVFATDWIDGDGRQLFDARAVGGAIEVGGVQHLMEPAVWRLVSKMRSFASRTAEQRNEEWQRRAWGEMRRLACEVGAGLDDFLYRTVVLTPDRLQPALRRAEDLGLVEVEPWFEGAPSQWLDVFDRSPSVRDRYDLVTPEGIVQVMIAPEVRTVLTELKRFPGRRVTGARAQAFLLNPGAALGPDATKVINEQQFERAKEEAGIAFDRFAAITPESHGEGMLGLLVTSTVGGDLSSRQVLLGADDVLEFVQRVEAHLEQGLQLCSWDDFEFELDGDSELHCAALRRALEHVSSSVIRHEDIYDLTGYSERVEGIGQEKPFYSPHVAKRSDGEGWVPENLAPMISWTDRGTGDVVALPITDATIEGMATAVEQAQSEGAATITVAGCPEPMPVSEAEGILRAFGRVRAEVGAATFAPATPTTKRPALILKANIDQVDYKEARLAALAAPRSAARLPSSVRQGVSLKEHQLTGVSWLQHLLALAPDRCRGCLLADDMGLGKTLQLLCLIARAREEDPTLEPALIVAPLSLLENWREEAEKFLEPGSLKILTAYGVALSELRASPASVDEQLRREGLVRFLRPGWRGDADVVLTTYETLRDLEFSFARERWSVMVCDEAQKIKNPNAAMTRAAKKQQARFRVACTGTPVENSLVDLWCLFDFVQPGLLGSLNDFAANYRRPIEAEGDADRRKLDELRSLIEPQIMRRMKADVATELKAKLVDGASRRLPLSDEQRRLYVGAIEGYRREAGRQGAALALLHRLRLVCSEPGAGSSSEFEDLDRYRAMSPKLDWLIRTVNAIRDRGEKLIIFCEFKHVQRLIRHYLRQAFGIDIDIINGDTSASSLSADSRQKRIRAFQEKEGFAVIILSPVAVGFGVNMQAANHVVHFTRTWNPAKEDQATDRAYRIGQTRDVHVYYPTVAAQDFTTFDVKLDELLERKRSLAGDMLNGAGDVGAKDFDIDELQAGFE
jgi:hypothetical protein